MGDGMVELEVWPKKGQSAYVQLPKALMNEVAQALFQVCLVDETPPEDNVVQFRPRKSDA
jgi:hypothetical protein